MTRFLFGRYVEGDLREIRDLIAKNNPGSARRLMMRFVEAFRLLANRPELGHVREDLPVPPLRFWPVGSYLVLPRGEAANRDRSCCARCTRCAECHQSSIVVGRKVLAV